MIDLCTEGIVSNDEWIELTLVPSEENYLEEAIECEIKHVTYSEILQFGAWRFFPDNRKYKVTGKIKETHEDDVIDFISQAWHELNVVTMDDVYGLELLVALRNYEIDSGEFEPCERCLENSTDEEREKQNCDGDLDIILDELHWYKEDKNLIDAKYKLVDDEDGQLKKKLPPALRIKYETELRDRELDFFSKMDTLSNGYRLEIPFFDDTLFICPYRIIESWMPISYRLTMDCLDHNTGNFYQYPRGKGLLNEWAKSYFAVNIIRSKHLYIRSEKDKAQRAQNKSRGAVRSGKR